ncbi:MAG: hypothetical protein V1860_03970 [bacterium]
MQNINKNSIFNDNNGNGGNYPYPEDDEYLKFAQSEGGKKEEISADENQDINGENNEINNFSPVKLFAVRRKLLKIRNDINAALKILEDSDANKNYEEKLLFHAEENADDYEAARVIEGIFDGERMVAEDGEKFNIPPNYASKSKLVEGDLLKLRILASGAFRYKQIEKIERKNIVGTVAYNEETREYFAVVEDKKYKVLAASITYYKARPGDEITVTVPKYKDSDWAAVDNVKI